MVDRAPQIRDDATCDGATATAIHEGWFIEEKRELWPIQLLLPGGAYFDSAESFGMIRAGKVDLTVLGAMEVSDNGDIANWKIPGKMVKGMGGAMDLVASAKNIIVAMQHVNKAGESKLLTRCKLPLTGINCVKKIVTELAVLDVLPEGGFKLLERAPGVTIEEIQKATEGKLIIEGEIPEMVV